MYDLLFNFLPFCRTKINRRHYGLYDITGNIKTKSNKLNVFAIPFTSSENPNITSEFSNINITLFFTIVAYLQTKYILRPYDYNDMILNIYSDLNNLSDDKIIGSILNNSPLCLKVKSLFNVTSF